MCWKSSIRNRTKSSAALYGIAKIRFHERSFPAAANEYRAALMGDLKWTKV